MNISALKDELELALRITEWSPTEEQLLEIARKLNDLKGKPSKSDINRVVLQVVGSYKAILLDGIDNSDLTTLLMIATKMDSGK